MSREAHGAEHFDPARYPALVEFLPAYLNEDFGEKYGTAAAAFRRWLRMRLANRSAT